MRPVDKTGQGAYEPAVDVSTQNDLETSLDAITITFGSTAAAPIRAVWGKSNPTAKQVLDGLLMIAKAPKTPPKKKAKTVPSIDQVKGVKETLTNKLATIYGTASGPLELQLGRFCSFCETYYPSGLAVEHITPKAPYPMFYIAWDNFLLACPVCNSNKLSKPPRADPLFAPPPADEVGYFTEIKDNYLWPQWFTRIYRTTKPRLEYRGAGGLWFKVTRPVAVGTELTVADKETRTLKGDVCTNVTKKGVTKLDWLMSVPVRVSVVPTDVRSTKIVAMLGLNKPTGSVAKPGGEADIRMWSRTEHWFKVLSLLQILQSTDATTFDLMWSLMMASVQQPGLYSVWVTVIDLLGPGGSWHVPGTATPVMSKFLTEIVGAAYFPGTDTADTP